MLASKLLDVLMPPTFETQELRELCARVRTWLEEYPFTVEEKPPGLMIWLLMATGSAGEYAIGVGPDVSERISIASYLDFPPEVSFQISEATLQDIRTDLLAFGVMTRGLERPLRRVQISTGVYWVGAGQDQFIVAIERVMRALIFIVERIKKSAPGVSVAGIPSAN